jgi:YcxB-like protein
MEFKLNYASRRGEVWRWYWRMWRQRLWKLHAAIIASVGVLVAALARTRGLSLPSSVLEGLVFGLVAAAWLPLYPMVMFKPQGRSLIIDPKGITTTIRAQNRSYVWSDFRSVSLDRDCIAIERHNGNAFVIPARAFESPDHQEKLLSFLRTVIGESARP